MIIRGNMIDGAEAERIGLVDHLVDEETAFEEFESLLAEYASTDSAASRASKQLLLDCFDLGWDAFFPQVPGAAGKSRGRARLRGSHGGVPGRPRGAVRECSRRIRHGRLVPGRLGDLDGEVRCTSGAPGTDGAGTGRVTRDQ